MRVLLHPEAAKELQALPRGEYRAVQHAIEKLAVAEDRLGFPHSSAVKGADRLRELRPRGGRSPWRALYRRVSDAMVIGAIGPEARSDPRGFESAVQAAENRLAELESERR